MQIIKCCAVMPSLKNIQFLSLDKLLGSFCNHPFVLSDQFCSSKLNMSSEYSLVHFRIYPATSMSSHIISKE